MDGGKEQSVTFTDGPHWSRSEQYEAGLREIDAFDWGLPSSPTDEEQVVPVAVAISQPADEDDGHDVVAPEVSSAVTAEPDSEATGPEVRPVTPEVPIQGLMEWESIAAELQQPAIEESEEFSTLMMDLDEVASPEHLGEQLAAGSGASSEDAPIVRTIMEPVEQLSVLATADTTGGDSGVGASVGKEESGDVANEAGHTTDAVDTPRMVRPHGADFAATSPFTTVELPVEPPTTHSESPSTKRERENSSPEPVEGRPYKRSKVLEMLDETETSLGRREAGNDALPTINPANASEDDTKVPGTNDDVVSADSQSVTSGISDPPASSEGDKAANAAGDKFIPTSVNKQPAVSSRELKALDKISPKGKTRRQTKDMAQAKPSGAAKRRHRGK
ncbi:hypothetical protein B0A55_11281 [Friedmanniomyces simplex]|uniref:Uncharacterized protein n=1 Tax=Friedmanniomyces simplex TaxID=329884 RepID=A0A4U0WUV0_9PEZI|nr:hypothetical protein B0A55_11281 [Friedmanniomyces simplex]